MMNARGSKGANSLNNGALNYNRRDGVVTELCNRVSDKVCEHTLTCTVDDPLSFPGFFFPVVFFSSCGI